MKIPRRVLTKLRKAGYIPLNSEPWRINKDTGWAAKYYMGVGNHERYLVTVAFYTENEIIEVLKSHETFKTGI